MCFAAAPLISGAMSAATAIAGFQSQQATYAQQLTQYNQNYQDALSDNRHDETILTTQQQQTEAAYRSNDLTQAIMGAEKASMVRAAAATGGVGGPSVSDVVNGISEGINTNRTNLLINWKGQAVQLQSQKDSSVDQEMARIGQVASPIEPNPAGAILGAAGGLISGAAGADKAGFFGTPSSSTTLNTTPIATPAAAPAAPAVNSFGIGMM